MVETTCNHTSTTATMYLLISHHRSLAFTCQFFTIGARPFWHASSQRQAAIADAAASSNAADRCPLRQSRWRLHGALHEKIPGTDVTFEMIPIPGGEFLMGSPATEAHRSHR